MFDGPIRQLPLKIVGHSIRSFCQIGPEGTTCPCIFDTGAVYTAIPQKFWSDQFRREEIDRPEFKTVNRVSVFGQTCRAKRVPVQIVILGELDPQRLLEPGKEEYLNDNEINFGECLADFLFDEELPVFVPQRKSKRLRYVYIGLGGGTFRNGGLCINWVKPEAVLVEQLG